MKSTAFIIGAGIAGIASAIRLAAQGYKVIVFEKNSVPGGKIGLLEKDGYRFDTGPSLFTQPQLIEELFTLTVENIKDYLSYKPVENTCTYFYEDGTIVNAWSDVDKFAAELQNKVGEKSSNIKSYLKRSAKVYNCIGRIFLEYSLHKAKTLFNAPILKAMRCLNPALIFSSLNQLNTSSFTKPQTVQLFNRYATYNGSNPYKAPAMLCVIPHIEFNEGVFYPAGGMIRIVNALFMLAKKIGVEFVFETEVSAIIVDKQNAKGIVCNNENLFADIIVSNADVYATYKYLLHDELSASKILKQERSSSAMIFYWGIGKEFPQLQLHNIFFSKDYKNEFDAIFNTKELYTDPTVYINITAKQEPEIHAPLHKENWFVMINVPSDSKVDWEMLIPEAKHNIIKKLNRILQTDIESLIEVEEVLTPSQIEINTSSYQGAIYGTSSNNRRAAFLRHPNFSTSIQNLYFAGGSVHPGGGIPLCLQSAKITCDIIIQDKSKRISMAHA